MSMSETTPIRKIYRKNLTNVVYGSIIHLDSKEEYFLSHLEIVTYIETR